MSDRGGNFPEAHELRWNPLIGTWIIVAGHRKKRPWRPEESGKPFCPFCPGAPETKKFGNNWDVIVLPNRFPALTLDAPEPVLSENSLFKASRAIGICEVVVETPKHEGDLCDLSLEHMVKVINAYTREYERLGKLDFISYVAVFRNKGKEIGVSLTHPHSQIYALPFIPPRIKRELEMFRKHYEEKGTCLLGEIIKAEITENKRIIYENNDVLVILPYYAMWPYEIHIYLKRHAQSLLDLDKDEKRSLADALRIVTGTYNSLFDRDMPYIMAFHQAPVNGDDYSYYHFHVEFYQPYRERDKLKYAAGIEWGYWTFTYDGVPESKAEELRRACRKAYKKYGGFIGRCF